MHKLTASGHRKHGHKFHPLTSRVVAMKQEVTNQRDCSSARHRQTTERRQSQLAGKKCRIWTAGIKEKKSKQFVWRNYQSKHTQSKVLFQNLKLNEISLSYLMPPHHQIHQLLPICVINELNQQHLDPQHTAWVIILTRHEKLQNKTKHDTRLFTAKNYGFFFSAAVAVSHMLTC